MSSVLNKIKQSVKQEKEMVNDKPLAVTKNDDRFEKADKYFAGENIHQPKIEQVKIEKPAKEPLVTSTFALPISEFRIVEEIRLLFAKNNIMIKQTDVFRIAISIVKNHEFDTLLDLYNNIHPEKLGSIKNIR